MHFVVVLVHSRHGLKSVQDLNLRLGIEALSFYSVKHSYDASFETSQVFCFENTAF